MRLQRLQRYYEAHVCLFDINENRQLQGLEKQLNLDLFHFWHTVVQSFSRHNDVKKIEG